jgi:hypothetical protein
MIGIDRLKVYSEKRTREKYLDKELQIEADEFMREFEAVKGMLSTPGWKVVRKYLTNCIDVNRKRLDFIDLKSEEALRIQAEITAFKTVLFFIESKKDFDI